MLPIVCAHAVLEHHLLTSKDNGCGGRNCPCPDNACLSPWGFYCAPKMDSLGTTGQAWQAYKAEQCTGTCPSLHTKNISDTNTDDSAAAVQVDPHQKLKKMRQNMDQKITCLWKQQAFVLPQTHSPEQILKGNNLTAAMPTRDPMINIGSNQMHYDF